MKNILIAEDDFYIRDIYNNVFVSAGFNVQLAIDGIEALEKVKTQPFDIILLDIMMPRMTGIDVLKAIRALETTAKNTPIFMITNLGQQDVIEEAFKLGMDGYIIKSQVTPQQIVSEINTFFEGKTQVQPATPLS